MNFFSNDVICVLKCGTFNYLIMVFFIYLLFIYVQNGQYRVKHFKHVNMLRWWVATKTFDSFVEAGENGRKSS